MSFSHYGSDLHEQEFLNQIFSTLTIKPRIIHVHSSLDFSKMPENCVIVYGLRDNWSWRKSWISHRIKKMIRDFLAISKQKNFQSNLPNSVYQKMKEIYDLFASNIHDFYENPTIKRPSQKILTHKMTDMSMLNTIQMIFTHLKINQEEIHVTRFKNSKISNLEKHDTEGLLVNTIGTFLSSFTYPMHLFLFYIRKIISIFVRGESKFSKIHESPRGKKEIRELEEHFIKQFRSDLIFQNVLKNPNFENSSSEISFINSDHTFFADDWYINRGGEIIFRQFSRSKGKMYPGELECFIEIENSDSTNTFFEILQEINLEELCLKLEGEKCNLAFEVRKKDYGISGQRYWAITYYGLEDLIHDKFINTVHEINIEADAMVQPWQKFSCETIIPREAKRIFVGILVHNPIGLNKGLNVHLKNMHFSLR